MDMSINYFITHDNKHCFEIKHLFIPSYFDTIAELDTAYQSMIAWLEESIKEWDLSPIDNAAFSDLNEDPWIGYYLTLNTAEDAVMFKTRWG